jgi:hypothetical protein
LLFLASLAPSLDKEDDFIIMIKKEQATDPFSLGMP